MLLRSASCIVVLLSALWLGGCSDTITAQAPPSASTLARQYDRTLTKIEKEAVISELKETQQKGASPEEATQAEDQN
jgi:hypothetical protein